MAKKEKKSVVGLRPTTSYSPVRGPNQDYGGVGVKNSNADYTISDEHIHDMSKVADQPEGHTTKESKDASFAGFFSAVQTAVRTGTFDTFLKNFEGYKQATPEEIEDAWRLEPGQGQKALLDIDTAINNAKVIAQNYDYTRKKLKAVVNPNDFAENTPEREVANIYNEGYLQGINNLVYMNAAFTNNAERLNKMYKEDPNLI